MSGEVRPGRRAGIGWRRRMRRARGGPDSRLWGGQGTRGAHVEHLDHDRDLGRVEAERLVELVRALPRRKAGMRCGKRCGPGGVKALGGGDTNGVHGEGPTQGCRAKGTRLEHAVRWGSGGRKGARTRRTRLKGWGQGTRGERTLNMYVISVTLEVSKLSGWLNALDFCRVESRACDVGRAVRVGRRGS